MPKGGRSYGKERTMSSSYGKGGGRKGSGKKAMAAGSSKAAKKGKVQY